MVMKRISIKDAKAQLSAAITAAEAGATIVITRHNEPVAHLGPARAHFVQQGRRVGAARLVPAMSGGTGGRYLSVLQEDRGGQ
jgi:prevent-host-death family protein